MKPKELAHDNAELVAELDRRRAVLDRCYGELIESKRGIIRREFGWMETLDLITRIERRDAPRRTRHHV